MRYNGTMVAYLAGITMIVFLEVVNNYKCHFIISLLIVVIATSIGLAPRINYSDLNYNVNCNLYYEDRVAAKDEIVERLQQIEDKEPGEIMIRVDEHINEASYIQYLMRYLTLSNEGYCITSEKMQNKFEKEWESSSARYCFDLKKHSLLVK